MNCLESKPERTHMNAKSQSEDLLQISMLFTHALKHVYPMYSGKTTYRHMIISEIGKTSSVSMKDLRPVTFMLRQIRKDMTSTL